VSWGLLVCHAGHGGSSAPPTSLVFDPAEVYSHCYGNPFTIQFELLAESRVYNATASLSASAIVLTTEWQDDEEYQAEEYGLGSEGQPSKKHCTEGDPVNCATGNLTESQTDLTVGGLGPVLGMTRSYNSQFAAGESEHGIFGYGWTGSYSAHLALAKSCETCSEVATVYQDNGSVVPFEKSGELWVPLAPLVQATLKKEGTGYVYTLPDQTKLAFESSGRLTSETDRDGNALTMHRNAEGRLESISDYAGRKLALAYNSSGEVESVTDPMGHTVKYTYEAGSLVSVTQPGETSIRWKFKYNASHELTEVTDGRGNTTTTEYNGSHQVVAQTDALKRKRSWKYGAITEGTYTEITEPNGSVTRDEFNSQGLPVSITHAYGTGLAATTSYEYDGLDNLIAVTNPDKHTTKYGYSAAGDRTSEIDPDGDETRWTYDSKHDVMTIRTPDGGTTEIRRDEDGDPGSIIRPAGGGNSYKYGSHGEIESVTNGLGESWKYEYDAYGDRTAETPPNGYGKRTWEYNEDSQEISTISPEGNLLSGEPAKFKTTIERDAQGRPLKVAEPEPGGAGKPNNKMPPSIAGVVREGQTLTATAGIWQGVPPVTYTYQWQQCKFPDSLCSNITGATSATYAATSANVGHPLRVVVTATNSAGSASSESEIRAVTSTSDPEFVSEFGVKGTESGQFIDPGDVAVDSKGNLWVLDYGNDRVEEFTEKGEFIKAFGSEGSGNGQLKEPGSLAVDSKGNIWVADTVNRRVEEFNEKGEYVKSVGSPGSGGGEFSLRSPEGLAIDAHGDIWADTSNGRIEEFNEKGEFMLSASSEGEESGELNNPAALAVGPGGDVWVVDGGGEQIEVFSEKGEFVREFGGRGGGEPGHLERPYGIALDSSGDSWVGDVRNDRLEEYNEKGGYENEFGSGGTSLGQFNFGASGKPMGIAIDSKGDIWIADSENNRIEKWKAGNNLTNMVPATISGELIVGQTLSAGVGTWAATPAPTYTYQWQQCNAIGESCSNISGATSATYTLSSSNLGYTLRVVITATNSTGSLPNTSAATTAIRTQSRTTEYAYDADGDIETVTDPDGNKVEYTYDADDEPVKVQEPDGSVTETEYDAEGNSIAQTDGNKHTTKYVRNALERVTEVIDPKGRKTIDEYDAAGNLTKLTDAAKRTTTYTYDPASRLKEISYSDGKTHAVEYEYNKDGKTTVMKDGPGTAKYNYDANDRLIESENGHKEVIKNEYNKGNLLAKITYPNGKAVTRTYNSNGLLEEVTNWEGHSVYSYNADADLTKVAFFKPDDEDKYSYNEADELTGIEMLHSEETLASLAYTHNGDEQVTSVVSKGLPGEEKTAYEYDASSRLTKAAGTAYEYDPANNPTKIASGTYSYSSADELESGPETKYTYNEVGQRTKTTPTTGPATTYAYDQAGNLISAERPKEGETPKIEDTYTYNGENLRTSQTISGTTNYLTWDTTEEELPLLLSDGTNSYIYGPDNLPIEQINNTTGTTQYLHHDQQGSTRLITGETGKTEATMTYNAYGNPTGHTGTATTPLGYDAQYTSADTGLIYLRAREYDPSTDQFLSVDPLNAVTGAPYNYANDNPANYIDPSGLCSLNPIASNNCFSEVPPAIGGGVVSVVEAAAQHPVESGGIVLGGVSLATGAGEVVAGGAIVTEGTLGSISAGAGLLGAGADAKECVSQGGVACVGAFAGGVGAVGGFGVAIGALADEARAGTTAIGLTASGIGFLGDAAGAAASPGTTSNPEAGCG
jgi:RHS repeat-associated protein